MNENPRMYLYIHSIHSIQFYSIWCALFIFFVRELASAHAFDWSTINTSFMDFLEMVFLIKLVHFGRYSFLFCALFTSRESGLHVYFYFIHIYCKRRMAFSKIYIKQSSRSSSFHSLLGKFPTEKFFLVVFFQSV